MDFVSKLLKVSPVERMTAEQALAHPWFKVVEFGREFLARSLFSNLVTS
jgi:serine/threonine protein kinase